ncbi:Fucose permease [Ensifer adhaerens]|nr:Fucose permease [Ensifer adhaerens]
MNNSDLSKEARAGRSGYFTRERLAVSTLFFINGLIMGAWAPKIPEFASRLGLDPGALGIMILVMGVGSLMLMPITGAQIARFGSTKVTKTATILFLPTILLLSLAPNIWLGGIAIFLFGGLTGAMDVSMNANAVETEKSMRRSIMSSCHAFWSLGTFVGTMTGGFLIEKLGTVGHSVVLTVAGFGLLAVVWTHLFHDVPHVSEAREKAKLPLSPLPWLLGIMALFSMVPEGSVLDWGALYIRRELGASLAFSGFAFGAFAFTMTVMRFAGDLVRDRFGAVKTFRFCTIMAIIGLVTAGSAPNMVVAFIGFAICGVGISNMVPIAFSAAGNLPGFAQGVALSVTTFLGYSGMLFAPSAIGFAAEHTSFSTVFLTLPVFLLAVLALSGLAKYADAARH